MHIFFLKKENQKNLPYLSSELCIGTTGCFIFKRSKEMKVKHPEKKHYSEFYLYMREVNVPVIYTISLNKQFYSFIYLLVYQGLNS